MKPDEKKKTAEAEEAKTDETLPEGALEGVAGGGKNDGKMYTLRDPWAAPLPRE